MNCISTEDVVQCSSCKTVFRGNQCPSCKSQNFNKLCPKQWEYMQKKYMGEIEPHGEAVYGIRFCDVCGEPVCPICGNHNVTALSRITGYISSVSGWNMAKRQELEERRRYRL